MAATSTGSVPALKSPQLSDSELQSSFSLLPHVLKLAKALYNGADTQSIHATVGQSINDNTVSTHSSTHS